MEKLSIEDMKELADELNGLRDKEILRRLTLLKEEGIYFKILIDNDDVYVRLGEDEEGESIGFRFEEYGYSLLPILFNFLDMNAGLV